MPSKPDSSGKCAPWVGSASSGYLQAVAAFLTAFCCSLEEESYSSKPKAPKASSPPIKPDSTFVSGSLDSKSIRFGAEPISWSWDFGDGDDYTTFVKVQEGIITGAMRLPDHMMATTTSSASFGKGHALDVLKALTDLSKMMDLRYPRAKRLDEMHFNPYDPQYHGTIRDIEAELRRTNQLVWDPGAQLVYGAPSIGGIKIIEDVKVPRGLCKFVFADSRIEWRRL